ncbi:MAG: CAP domain-containing protein [Beijerinckiaceae bacterium]|nr:CAP domain-containing protein [Beijerinckiaceae bacterium]
MKIFFNCAVVALVLTTVACATPLPPEVSTRNRPDILTALNEARSKAGIAAVKADSRLDAVARQRAPKAWLNRDNLRAAHSGFGAAVEGSGFPGRWTGEAYWAGPPSDSPSAIIAYLLASPPHRAILMSPRANVCAAASSADRRDMTVAIACGHL